MRIVSGRGRTLAFGIGALGALLPGGAPVAQGGEAPLSIWTSEAPIASVLEQVVGSDVFDVRVGEGVEGEVSGRLEGSVSEVLEPLLDRYTLSVHNDGSTVWFDRRDREVSEAVELDPSREPALAEWAARELDEDAPGRRGRVTREGDMLRVRGTRAFVQSTLGRIEAARGVLSEASVQPTAPPEPAAPAQAALSPAAEPTAAEPLVTEANEAPAIAATSVWREPPETLAMPDAAPAPEGSSVARTGPPFSSVTDIPGFHTEYR